MWNVKHVQRLIEFTLATKPEIIKNKLQILGLFEWINCSKTWRVVQQVFIPWGKPEAILISEFVISEIESILQKLFGVILISGFLNSLGPVCHADRLTGWLDFISKNLYCASETAKAIGIKFYFRFTCCNHTGLCRHSHFYLGASWQVHVPLYQLTVVCLRWTEGLNGDALFTSTHDSFYVYIVQGLEPVLREVVQTDIHK